MSNEPMIPRSHSVAGMSEASSLIPAAPECEEYAQAMRLAGVTHESLIKDTTQQGASVQGGSVQSHDNHGQGMSDQSLADQKQGARVVLNTDARDATNISADAIERARREVVRATNAIQSRFVLGIVPSVRQGDGGA